jgi:O-antigen/teichoic acid export membrane protein
MYMGHNVPDKTEGEFSPFHTARGTIYLMFRSIVLGVATVFFYMLLLLSNLNVVGLYSPAIFFGYVLVLAQTSLDQSLSPLFSRRYGRSGIDSLHQLSYSASRYIFLIYLPIGFIVFASSLLILTALLGEMYEPSIYPTMAIELSLTFTGMTLVFNNVLMSSGYSSIFLKTSGRTLTVQLVVSYLAIPSLGGLGASIAKGIVYLILFLYPALELKKVSRLSYDLKSLKLGLCGSLLVATTIFTPDYYVPRAYFIPINISLGSAFYLLFLRFTDAINSEDLEVFDKILAGRARRLRLMVGKVVMK